MTLFPGMSLLHILPGLCPRASVNDPLASDLCEFYVNTLILSSWDAEGALSLQREYEGGDTAMRSDIRILFLHNLYAFDDRFLYGFVV